MHAHERCRRSSVLANNQPCLPTCRTRSAIDPAAARVDFINALTAQLWPHAERAASRLLLKDGFLERLL